MKADGEYGFTLIETLVALLIVGLSAALTLPAISDVVRRHANAQADQRLADQALSVLAAGERSARLEDRDGAFQDWQLIRRNLPDTEPYENTVPAPAYWLEAVHTPSGKRFRVLIVP